MDFTVTWVVFVYQPFFYIPIHNTLTSSSDYWAMGTSSVLFLGGVKQTEGAVPCWDRIAPRSDLTEYPISFFGIKIVGPIP